MIAQALALLDQSILPTWIIVGYGNPTDVRMLKLFCKENKIKMVLKPCFGAEKWMWIKRSKLMLCGWCGIPSAEGILCDIPVLSFNHPDIQEMYSHGIYWAYDNDTVNYAGHIQKVFQHIEKKEKNPVKYAKNALLSDCLYATTQELLAKKYEEIFKGE